jgi:hypothetical protein
MNLSSINNGDYIKVRNVDFLDGVTSFEARVSAASDNAKIELRLDSQTGTLLGTCDVAGASSWSTKTCTVSGGSGTHDLFLKFTGGSGELFKFNWWKFSGPTTGGGTGGAGGMSGAGGAAPGGSAGLGGTGGVSAGAGGMVSAAGSGGTPGAGGAVAQGGGNSSGGSSLPAAGRGATGGVTGPAPSANNAPKSDSGCSYRAFGGENGVVPFAALLPLVFAFYRRARRSTGTSR